MSCLGRGLMIAAPSSGAGKTTVTLGILAALARSRPVRGAKSGPDYIDPRFHEAATGRPSVNLDAWSMGTDRLRSLAACPEDLVVEAAMGLFDGAPDGRGSAAALSVALDLPVVLVVDAARTAQSVAPLVEGFVAHDPQVRIAGVILNRVGSHRHETLLRDALDGVSPVLGAIGRDPAFAHPSRHLGLVQAAERPDLAAWLGQLADAAGAGIDLGALPFEPLAAAPPSRPFPPPAQRIAVARDAAFGFLYPHILSEWRTAGAEIAFFSPLADAAVPPADLIYLPGGYPELHAGRLAAASNFMQSMRIAVQDTEIYGECGGYMVLGKSIADAAGACHAMAGLLPLRTSFAARKLQLGYRTVATEMGPFRGRYAAHEFHYATVLAEGGRPLFDAWDAEGTPLGPMGRRVGRASGSFAHLIEPLDAGAPAP